VEFKLRLKKARKNRQAKNKKEEGRTRVKIRGRKRWVRRKAGSGESSES
jgi:hypothetical protein